MTHPSVNSIVERFQGLLSGRITPAYLGEAESHLSALATIISELQAELQDAKTVIAQLNERSAQYERSTYAAESSLSRIKEETIEACALVAEHERQNSNQAYQRGDAARFAVIGFEQACEDIASAIRSLGSTGGAEKTAESEHFPSTPTTATE